MPGDVFDESGAVYFASRVTGAAREALDLVGDIVWYRHSRLHTWSMTMRQQPAAGESCRSGPASSGTSAEPVSGEISHSSSEPGHKEVYNGDIGQVADVDPDAGELTGRFDGRERARLRPGRAGHAGAHLRRDRAQEPGLGVSGRGHPGADPVLRDAAAEPPLHRGDAWQAAGGARGQ